MNRHIMVVDSDPALCRRIQKVLATTQNTVSYAFDAVTAVAGAKVCCPELMIVDLGLIAGGGLSVVEHVRAIAELANVPIIVTAGRGARMEAARVLDAGADAFLPKPLDPYLLLEYVNRFLPEETAGPWTEVSQPWTGGQA